MARVFSLHKVAKRDFDTFEITLPRGM